MRIQQPTHRMFQHTAARRRLHDLAALVGVHVDVSTHSRPKAAASILYDKPRFKVVSTHSRPKAAARVNIYRDVCLVCFNTQPPEGGCHGRSGDDNKNDLFQHTAARRRLPATHLTAYNKVQFQHTAARRRLQKHCKKSIESSWFQHTAARRRLLFYKVTKNI